MQMDTVDLIRLAVSGAVICAVVGAVEWRALHHGDPFANAKIGIPPPIHVKAILVPALPICWTSNEPIGAPATQDTQTERGAMARSCASVAPAPRRHGEPRRLLAFAL